MTVRERDHGGACGGFYSACDFRLRSKLEPRHTHRNDHYHRTGSRFLLPTTTVDEIRPEQDMKPITWRPAALFLTLAFAAVLILTPLPALAESPEEKGLRIALEAKARDKGYGNYTADQTMILRNT